MNFAAHVTIFKGLLTRSTTLALITTSENSYSTHLGEGQEDKKGPELRYPCPESLSEEEPYYE
jgi:hypothetical protein